MNEILIIKKEEVRGLLLCEYSEDYRLWEDRSTKEN